jgi:uncharacterized membrane protein
MKYTWIAITFVGSAFCVLASRYFLPRYSSLIFVIADVVISQGALVAVCLARDNRRAMRFALLLLLLAVCYVVVLSVRVRPVEAARSVPQDELEKAIDRWRSGKE